MLAVVSDAFELDVGDRRVTANHVDALMKVDFKELLDQLSKAELKVVCAELGLATSGTIQELTERILRGGEEADKQGRKHSSARPAETKKKTAMPAPPVVTTEPRKFNGFSEIVSFIWSVADLLRGDYKQSEYGRVILPFLVLRRLDQVLAPTRKAVLAADAKYPADKTPEALRERMPLKASGETFVLISFWNRTGFSRWKM